MLYSSTQHAREWIANEVNRRLMNWYIDRWRANDPEIKQLLQTTELWFILVANPDGYEYTFDVERLWRKNLRDNNNDGEITVGDGVDPNRNFPNHFKYDEEGSSSIASSETYRGPAAVSEPETQAMKGLLDRIGFEFQVNWHSNGQWLLYAEGWQIATPTADDPIYFALSGNLDRPAIRDFHPGLSSDVLYVTNGETTDYAHASAGALAWTPELSAGCPNCGFVFPDDEALVQAEFERNLPFALSVAKSADDPDDPESVLGIETKPFYTKSDDPYKDGIPGVDFEFAYSYGDPAAGAGAGEARASAPSRSSTASTAGGVQSAPTSEWAGGERYTPADVHYRELRGVVTGTSPGDSVEVWFEGGGERSDSFTYRAVSETGRRVLVVAAEDYSGAVARADAGPALPELLPRTRSPPTASRADVYDVDARGRVAPGPSRRAQPLRRGDLVHGRRQRHPPARPGRRERRPPGDGRDPRVPRLHERGRPRRLHRRVGRPAVRARRRGRPAVLRPEGRGPVPDRRGPEPGVRPAAVPRGRRLAEQRRDQRRPAVLVRRVRAGRGRRARS